MLDPARSKQEYAEITDLFKYTLRAFHNYWERNGLIPNDDVNFLATATLSHIDDIDLGFKWVLRAEHVPREEAAFLPGLADVPDWTQEPGGAPSRPIAPDLRKVMALEHARVVFGYLPLTPTGHVSYPGYSSYSDIKVPRTPMELRERIEELARGVWDAATRRSPDTLDPERARRVYGFFEAGSRLTAEQQRRIQRQ